ncbi:MAG TPA: hypothetical protein VHH36_07495 [Candidatus Thermoplasmatota archaeon]|nr:hypothetical protein [Candidatus Thermoplasmatota archaeon]
MRKLVAVAVALAGVAASPIVLAEDPADYAVRDPKAELENLFQVRLTWQAPLVEPDALRVVGLRDGVERVLALLGPDATTVLVPDDYEAYRVDSGVDERWEVGVVVPNGCVRIYPSALRVFFDIKCLKLKTYFLEDVLFEKLIS